MRVSWFALLAAGCAATPTTCDFDIDGGPPSPEYDLVLGEIAEGEFVPFDDEGKLVMGAQGGWMVLLVIELPAELSVASCLELEVRPSLDGVPLRPIVRRFSSGRLIGPLPIFIGFDIDPARQSLTLRVTARTGIAAGEAEVVGLRLRDAS